MIYLKLFLTFLKIGAFTFGGGYAMLAFIQQEVIKNGWMSAEEIIDFVAISESTPGPFAVNASTYVGSSVAGIFGAFCATLGVVLPSFIIILIVARIYDKFKQSRLVEGAMIGLGGAVVGLIGAATVDTALAIDWSMLIGIPIFFLMLWGLMKKANPILMILLGAVAGIIIKGIW